MKRLIKLFWQIWFEFRKRVFGKPAPLRTTFVEEIPEKLDEKRLYLVGENDHFWFAVFFCPCGCGTTVQVSLLADSNPCWTFAEHGDGTISLSPSVWRKDGCRSHYHVRRGFVEWI